jgi:hypothetical protein
VTSDRRAYDPFAPFTPAAAAGPASAPVAEQHEQAQEPSGDAVEAAAQLPADIDDITKPDLIALAELAGVATYGTKAEIADRIREAAGQ